MSGKYKVKMTVTNGYRCCCYKSWEDEYEYDTEEEALENISTSAYVGESDYEQIVITDPDGKEIAYGMLSWYGTKPERYHNQKWEGHIKGVEFCEKKGNVK